ncbi:MAG: AMP-binding protein [Spirochaetales bacterium]|nr:AMP-binding protein [Spirochaetales bacterium]
MGKFGLERNTMDRFLKRCGEVYGDRPFLAMEGEDYISYGEFCRKVDLYRKILAEQGLVKGDAMALLASGSPQWAVMWMAAMTSGIVAVPIMEDFSRDDVKHILTHSEAKGLCLDSRFLSWELEEFASLDFLYDLTAGEFIRKKEPLDSLPAPVDPEEGDPAEYMYTSGTTGFSKGVVLTHANLVTNLFEGTDLIDECFDEDGLVLSLLPVGHTFGSTSAFLSTMYKGPRIAFLKRKPTVPYLAEAFQRNKPTIMGAVPLIFEKIYQKRIVPLKNKNGLTRFLFIKFPPTRKIFHRLTGRKILDFLGGRIRCIIIGGAPFSPEVEQFLKEGRLPYVLGYGLTETSPLLTFCSLKEVKTGSVGHAVRDTEIRVVNPRGEEGIGDIQVRGPQIMAGYLKDPLGTANMYTEDGWFITGDKGYLDREGFLFLKGRTKNVIVASSGENIYPEAIEALLTGEPMVEEVLVCMEEGKLIGRIFPNREYWDKQGGEESRRKEVYEELRLRINKKLPPSSYLYKLKEQKEPFAKTATKKIKRPHLFGEGGKR